MRLRRIRVKGLLGIGGGCVRVRRSCIDTSPSGGVERRAGNEPDAQLPQERQQPGLGVAGPQGVPHLQRGAGVHGVGAADRVGAGLGLADVADLALGHQLGQSADGVLYGGARVDAGW
jgi:hypothetical protein